MFACLFVVIKPDNPFRGFAFMLGGNSELEEESSDQKKCRIEKTGESGTKHVI